MIRGVSVAIEERLVISPADLGTARLSAADGGAPAAPGFYAWWLTRKTALPTVPASPHPTDASLGLVYVGIAPKDANSAETIRSRVLTKHLGKPLGSSTLRRGSGRAPLGEGRLASLRHTGRQASARS
jgi:hypothetical protein